MHERRHFKEARGPLQDIEQERLGDGLCLIRRVELREAAGDVKGDRAWSDAKNSSNFFGSFSASTPSQHLNLTISQLVIDFCPKLFGFNCTDKPMRDVRQPHKLGFFVRKFEQTNLVVTSCQRKHPRCHVLSMGAQRPPMHDAMGPRLFPKFRLNL